MCAATQCSSLYHRAAGSHGSKAGNLLDCSTDLCAGAHCKDLDFHIISAKLWQLLLLQLEHIQRLPMLRQQQRRG